MLMSGERVMSPERHAQLMADLGLDRPIYIQYFDYLVNLLQGDFGSSIVTKRPVLDRFPAHCSRQRSSCRSAPSFSLSVLGVPAGVLAAVKRGTWLDQTHDGHRARRLFDADLLVGAAARSSSSPAISAGRPSRAVSR